MCVLFFLCFIISFFLWSVCGHAFRLILFFLFLFLWMDWFVIIIIIIPMNKTNESIIHKKLCVHIGCFGCVCMYFYACLLFGNLTTFFFVVCLNNNTNLLVLLLCILCVNCCTGLFACFVFVFFSIYYWFIHPFIYLFVCLFVCLFGFTTKLEPLESRRIGKSRSKTPKNTNQIARYLFFFICCF